MTVVSTTLLVLGIAFLVVATVAALASVATITNFVVTNRRVRLARHESIRTYYGSFNLAS